MLIATKNITLENVKKSNYWQLIAFIVWNHYTEKKYQHESMVEISEQWYGKTKYSSSNTTFWNDPEYKNGDYVRTLQYILITFTRTDYITYIHINVESGNIFYFGIYTNKNNESHPNYYAQPIDLMNWMLENNFIELIKKSKNEKA